MNSPLAEPGGDVTDVADLGEAGAMAPAALAGTMGGDRGLGMTVDLSAVAGAFLMLFSSKR